VAANEQFLLGVWSFREAYRTMIAAAREHGKFPGMAGVYNETLMPRYIEMGSSQPRRR
jgi:hypothetical protein